MTQHTQTETPRSVRNAYDAGIMFGGAALVVIVVGLAIVLMAQAFQAAPVVSSMFAVGAVLGSGLFVLIIVRLARQFAGDLSAVHTTVAQASAQAFGQSTTAMLDYMKQQQLAAPTMTTYLPPTRAPELPAATSVPRLSANGRPVGVKLQTLTPAGELLTCSPAGLEAALKILAEGGQPTREEFKRKGILASMEAAGVVDWLAGQGQVTKGGQGAATRWADGVLPECAPTLADEFRPYCPSLPHFISPEPMLGNLTGAGQVGQQAGRQVRGGRK